MSLYYIANFYKDIDYMRLLAVMLEVSDSFFIRVSRTRIEDKYNYGRDDFMKLPKCIISESSRSKYYADMHFQITPELKMLLKKYFTSGEGLCAFGFYKNNIRIMCVEEKIMTYVLIPDNMLEVKEKIKNAGIKIDSFAAIMEPWVINEKGYEYYVKNPNKAKDIKFLMG